MESMQIIDAFCGIGPWAQRDRLLPSDPADTLAIMDHCGIDSAVVFGNLAGSWGRAHEANKMAAKAARECDRFIPAFVLAPQARDDGLHAEEYADQMSQAGAKAAWLWPHLGKQGHGLWNWLIGDLLAMCSENRVPLFLPADADEPDRIETICRDFPQLRLILVNLGYRADGWLFPLLGRHAELRVCLGPVYIPPIGPERFVEHFGADRLIFGSGLPHDSPGGLIGHVTYSRVSDADKEKILGGNMAALVQEVQL